MTVAIETLNGPGGLELLGGPNDLQFFGTEGLELLGPVCGPSMMGLGTEITDAEIAFMGKELGPQVKVGGDMGQFQLAVLFSNYSRSAQQKLGAAIIAAGGDAAIVGGALKDTVGSAIDDVSKPFRRRKAAYTVWGVLSTASAAASAYHGYKRNESVGWAIWWFIMGAFFPIITPAIALAQGFGQPEGV